MLHKVFEVDMGTIFCPMSVVISIFEFGIGNARNCVNSFFRTESSDYFMKVFESIFSWGVKVGLDSK